jgi:hypothetical protein
MAELIDAWQVELSERVKDLQAVQTGIKLPTPVIIRAEQLCNALEEAGEHKPDRQFLIAALIATTDPDADGLAARLREYRLAPVHDVLIGEGATEGKIKLQKPRG